MWLSQFCFPDMLRLCLKLYPKDIEVDSNLFRPLVYKNNVQCKFTFLLFVLMVLFGIFFNNAMSILYHRPVIQEGLFGTQRKNTRARARGFVRLCVFLWLILLAGGTWHPARESGFRGFSGHFQAVFLSANYDHVSETGSVRCACRFDSAHSSLPAAGSTWSGSFNPAASAALLCRNNKIHSNFRRLTPWWRCNLTALCWRPTNNQYFLKSKKIYAVSSQADDGSGTFYVGGMATNWLDGRKWIFWSGTGSGVRKTLSFGKISWSQIRIAWT